MILKKCLDFLVHSIELRNARDRAMDRNDRVWVDYYNNELEKLNHEFSINLRQWRKS